MPASPWHAVRSSADRLLSAGFAHVDELETRFGANRIDYALFNTAMPLDYALLHFLSRRERLARVK